MTTAGVCTFPTILGVIATGLMKMQMSRQEIDNLWSSHNTPGSQGCSLMNTKQVHNIGSVLHSLHKISPCYSCSHAMN